MKTIHISREAVVIVSDEDFDFLSSFNWSLNPQGTMYAVRKGRKNTGEPRTVAMHREIMMLLPIYPARKLIRLIVTE